MTALSKFDRVTMKRSKRLRRGSKSKRIISLKEELILAEEPELGCHRKSVAPEVVGIQIAAPKTAAPIGVISDAFANVFSSRRIFP